MSQEKLQILNMVKEGKITPAEGVELLSALGDKAETVNLSSDSKTKKCLRIKVLDKEDKVNVTIPVSLLRIGAKFASKFSPELEKAGLTEVDIEEILQAVDSGEIGKIVEVNSEDGTKVEVSVE